MPDTPTFAERMVTKYETLLEANAGFQTATIEGVAVAFTKLREDYEYWKKQVAIEAGNRPMCMQLDLSGGV